MFFMRFSPTVHLVGTRFLLANRIPTFGFAQPTETLLARLERVGQGDRTHVSNRLGFALGSKASARCSTPERSVALQQMQVISKDGILSCDVRQSFGCVGVLRRVSSGFRAKLGGGC